MGRGKGGRLKLKLKRERFNHPATRGERNKHLRGSEELGQVPGTMCLDNAGGTPNPESKPRNQTPNSNPEIKPRTESPHVSFVSLADSLIGFCQSFSTPRLLGESKGQPC